MKDTVALEENAVLLKEKTHFLSLAGTYTDTKGVDVIETHMSVVFLTDHFVYKLKKPVQFDFLDFSTIETRRRFCTEELTINKALGGDTYLSVIPLRVYQGTMNLGGKGETIDWLVKMKRLPAEQTLHEAIKKGAIPHGWLQKAANKLADFYIAAEPVAFCNRQAFRSAMIRDIEKNSAGLLSNRFKLHHGQIVSITTDLLHFIIKHGDLFDQRVAQGRVIDAHGDLRPEHIFLGPEPVMIDRLEFDRALRIMDVAEELSFLGLECEMLGAADIGQLFLDVYKERTADNIPDTLIHFYKAKRAFLRARLSINHLLESKYLLDSSKWTGKCNAYLHMAAACCLKT